MYRTVKSIVSNALLSLSLLPAVMIAAESDNAQNFDQRQGNAGQGQNDAAMQRGMMRGNPADYQNWQGNPQGTTYAQHGWRSESSTDYSQQGWRNQPSTTYSQQGWEGQPNTTYSQQGWSAGSHYSYEQPMEVHGSMPGSMEVHGNMPGSMEVHGSMPGSMDHSGYYMDHGYAPADRNYSSNAHFDHGVAAPSGSTYSYSPGFHRVRGRYYSSGNNYPTYSNYSYGNPSNGYYQDGNYGNYPNDRGMGAGTVYFNVR